MKITPKTVSLPAQPGEPLIFFAALRDKMFSPPSVPHLLPCSGKVKVRIVGGVVTGATGRLIWLPANVESLLPRHQRMKQPFAMAGRTGNALGMRVCNRGSLLEAMV